MEPQDVETGDTIQVSIDWETLMRYQRLRSAVIE